MIPESRNERDTSMRQVKRFIRGLRTWMDLEDEGSSFLQYGTRENGDMVNDEPGPADIKEARRIAKALKAEFGDVDLKVSVEYVDEWTMLTMSSRAKRASARRVKARYVRAKKPPGAITVNVWDDSPPGAPIIVEGDIPPDVTRAEVYQYLRGVIERETDFEISPSRTSWEDGRFHVEHPTQTSYDDAIDNQAHHKFLDDLQIILMREARSYKGHELYVVSES